MDIIKEKFKKLLGFILIIKSSNINENNLHINNDYIFEKFKHVYDTDNKEIIINYINFLLKETKYKDPYNMVEEFENIFGENTFFKINIDNNLILHDLLKQYRDKYIENEFMKSRKIKVHLKLLFR